ECSQTSTPRIGVAPCTSGFSPLGVLEISSLPFFTDNHAQPEPNWPTPAAAKSVLNFSNPPRSSVIFFSRRPGSLLPPPLGFIQFQKCKWLWCWPALLKSGAFLPNEPLTISSRDLPSNSVPFSKLLPLVT